MTADGYGIAMTKGQTYNIVIVPSSLENRIAIHYRGIWFKQRYMRLL